MRLVAVTLLTSMLLRSASAELKSCPLLPTAEAAIVLGPKTEFLSAVESPQSDSMTTHLCFLSAHPVALTVGTSPSSIAGDRTVWDTMREFEGARLVDGLGAYAHISRKDGKTELFIVSPPYTLQLSLDTAEPDDERRLLEIAPKVLSHLPR
jgi:hypothetical protein